MAGSININTRQYLKLEIIIVLGPPRLEHPPRVGPSLRKGGVRGRYGEGRRLLRRRVLGLDHPRLVVSIIVILLVRNIIIAPPTHHQREVVGVVEHHHPEDDEDPQIIIKNLPPVHLLLAAVDEAVELCHRHIIIAPL